MVTLSLPKWLEVSYVLLTIIYRSKLQIDHKNDKGVSQSKLWNWYNNYERI